MGTASLTGAADELPVDKKTFRKISKGQKVSTGTQNKLRGFAQTNFGVDLGDSDSIWLEGERNILPHAQWKGFLSGVRHISDGREKSFFFDQIERLLDEDIKIFQHCMENKDSPESHQFFWSSDLARQLLTPYGLKEIPAEEHHQTLRELGAWSLIFYFIGSCEITLKQKHDVEIANKSLVEDFLPSIVDGNIVWPIKKLTDFWTETFAVSVNKLAEFMPAKDDLDSESKERKLDYWRSGKNEPDIDSEESLFDWLESFCPDDKSIRQEFVRFQTVILLQRFFNFLLKNKVEQEMSVKAFSIYKIHYQENFNRFSA